MCFGVGGGGSCGHDRVNNSKGGGLLTLGGDILDPVVFDLTDEAPVQAGVSL